jgi:hypothetical protein
LVALIAGDGPHDSFWRSGEKKETSSKYFVNKYCLCQTDFSCHNDKGSVLSYSDVIRLDKTARNQWSSADKLASIRDVFRSIISRLPMEEQFSGVDG